MSTVPITRTDWVRQQLREAILTGQMMPGQRLITNRLAAQWELSQTPIREIYRELAAEGLIEFHAQKGARVADVSPEEMLDLYATRLLIEPLALELSVVRRDEAWRNSVQLAQAELRRVGEQHMPPLEFEAAHHALHTALLSRCPSPLLLRFIDNLYTHCLRYRLVYFNAPTSTDELLEEHDRLVEACLTNDPGVYRDQLKSHICLTLRYLLNSPDTMPPGLAEPERKKRLAELIDNGPMSSQPDATC